MYICVLISSCFYLKTSPILTYLNINNHNFKNLFFPISAQNSCKSKLVIRSFSKHFPFHFFCQCGYECLVLGSIPPLSYFASPSQKTVIPPPLPNLRVRVRGALHSVESSEMRHPCVTVGSLPVPLPQCPHNSIPSFLWHNTA